MKTFTNSIAPSQVVNLKKVFIWSQAGYSPGVSLIGDSECTTPMSRHAQVGATDGCVNPVESWNRQRIASYLLTALIGASPAYAGEVMTQRLAPVPQADPVPIYCLSTEKSADKPKETRKDHFKWSRTLYHARLKAKIFLRITDAHS